MEYLLFAVLLALLFWLGRSVMALFAPAAPVYVDARVNYPVAPIKPVTAPFDEEESEESESDPPTGPGRLIETPRGLFSPGYNRPEPLAPGGRWLSQGNGFRWITPETVAAEEEARRVATAAEASRVAAEAEAQRQAAEEEARRVAAFPAWLREFAAGQGLPQTSESLTGLYDWAVFVANYGQTELGGEFSVRVVYGSLRDCAQGPAAWRSKDFITKLLASMQRAGILSSQTSRKRRVLIQTVF